MNKEKKIVILDRDGVINHDSPLYIKCPEEWRPIHGSLEAIAKLNQAGFRVFIATNQSGIGRGFYDRAMLAKIHEKLITLLEPHGGVIEDIAFCPHHPDDNCNCRKPKPGLLIQLAKNNQFDLDNAYFIGDSFKDIQAAQACGATPILVKTGNGEKTLQENSEALKDELVFDTLSATAEWIVNKG